MKKGILSIPRIKTPLRDRIERSKYREDEIKIGDDIDMEKVFNEVGSPMLRRYVISTINFMTDKDEKITAEIFFNVLTSKGVKQYAKELGVYNRLERVCEKYLQKRR